MNQKDSKPKRRAGCSVSAVSREEWYKDLEQSVALGIAKPGQTYEEYLQGLYADYDYVFVPPDSRPYKKLSPEEIHRLADDLKEHLQVVENFKKLYGKPVSDKIQ